MIFMMNSSTKLYNVQINYQTEKRSRCIFGERHSSTQKLQKMTSRQRPTEEILATQEMSKTKQTKILRKVAKKRPRSGSNLRWQGINVDHTNRERFTPADTVTSKLQLIYVLKIMDTKLNDNQDELITKT